MMKSVVGSALFLYIRFVISQTDGTHGNAMSTPSSHVAWLVNDPPYFHELSKATLKDVRNDSASMAKFTEISDYFLPRTDAFTDGEVVDAIEHYFWGMRDGLAMELGALDGSPDTRSMTCEYEKTLNWRRILIEGNPSYKDALIKKSPLALSANAAICSTPSTVHYSNSQYVGGIVEFMGLDFLKQYHPNVYSACTPPGNISSLNFTLIPHLVKPVDCVPMSHVLHKAHVRHVNYFLLDVEGGELEVLRSINWSHVRFDVLCIETEEVNRPPGYASRITAYLAEKGYVNSTAQIGRNTWYTWKDFVPSSRPGLDPLCYNGARKSDNADKWFLNKKHPAFVRCPMS